MRSLIGEHPDVAVVCALANLLDAACEVVQAGMQVLLKALAVVRDLCLLQEGREG